jgi:hypothetical protein
MAKIKRLKDYECEDTTTSSVPGAGDDSSTVVVKKKKRKKFANPFVAGKRGILAKVLKRNSLSDKA